jgi:NitT/TauT family transport system permease protein
MVEGYRLNASLIRLNPPKTYAVFGILFRIGLRLKFDSAPRNFCGAFCFSLTPEKEMKYRFTPIILSTLAFLLAWHFFTRFGNIPNFILPSPLSVWIRFLKSVQDGSLPYHTSITLLEIVLGLLVGVVFATVVGYALAKSRSLERVLSPYLVASQAIPVIAIAPLLVIWLGDEILSKVVICALIVFFPVLVNTIVGVRAVPAALYDLMNSLHASRAQILRKIEIPASLPVFLGGLRIGATLSVIGAIVGELVSAEQGLGFLLQLGDFQYDTPMVFVAVFTLVALALMLYGIVRLLEIRFLRWQENTGG